MTENLITDQQIREVLNHYKLSFDDCEISPLGNGLINTTLLVKDQSKSLVLQKINQQVFAKPKLVIENMRLIHQHLTEKLKQKLYPFQSIGLVSTKNNQDFCQVNNELWRAVNFIEASYSVEAIDNPKQATLAASAFAQFTAALSDISLNKLHRTMPNFHHLASRMQQLQEALTHGNKKRIAQCQSLIDFCLSQQVFIATVTSFENILPLRVTHNDTKINNLLFCQTSQQPLAIIDLDTCMPGFIMHDFGDMVRSCCSTLAEDSRAVNDMSIRFDILTALAQAYVTGFDGQLSSTEQQSLVIGAQLMPFMLAIRFLTDYLNGDLYFQTRYEQHNLDRAANQIHLFKLLQQSQANIEQAIYTNEVKCD